MPQIYGHWREKRVCCWNIFFIDVNNKLSFLPTVILGISRNLWIAVFLYNLKSTKKVCFNINRMKNYFHCSKWYASVRKNQDKKTCSLASRANGYSSLDFKGRKINWQKKKIFTSLLTHSWLESGFVCLFVFHNANEKLFCMLGAFCESSCHWKGQCENLAIWHLIDWFMK